MKFYFAPLEGVTGFTYRNVFADLFGGVDKYYAPFISPCVNDKLKGKEIRDILPENNSGKVNLVPQILTNRADYFIKATKQIMDMGYTKEININIGCPSGTVVAKNKGSGFLRDTDAMDRFFEEIFNWRDSDEKGLDISVKTRIGVNDAEEFPDIMEVYNQYPISELTIHPRTRKQMYRDTPDMNAFDYAVKVSRNPLCYNGDIRTVMDYENFAKKYNVTGWVRNLYDGTVEMEVQGLDHRVELFLQELSSDRPGGNRFIRIDKLDITNIPSVNVADEKGFRARY